MIGKKVTFLCGASRNTLDFSEAEYETAADFKISLNYMLDKIAHEHGVNITKAYSPKTKLELLVEKLAVKNSVVVLIL